MLKIKPSVLLPSLVLASALACLAVAASVASAAPNSHPGYIRVVANNTENMPAPGNTAGCKGSWQSLPSYLGRRFAPDVMTLQQIDTKSRNGHKSQLSRYRSKLEQATGQPYKAIVSTKNPARMRSQGCQRYKTFQANAILYRAARFQKVGEKRVVQSLRSKSGQGCTTPNDQERSRIVYQQLRDLVAGGRLVNVASMHWPTSTHDQGKRCAAANGRRTRGTMRQLGPASLNIIAGDANAGPDTAGSWYQQMRKKAKYVDPVYRGCKGVPVCLAVNGTIGGAQGTAKRIDFIFAQGGSNKTKGSAIPFAATGGKYHYSQHRAVKAKVHYTG